MNRHLARLAAAFGLSLLLALPVSAVEPKELAKTLPNDINLVQAQLVIEAAVAKAKEIKVPMNIALVDAGGNLKAFYRMDDAFLGSIDISQKKAKTARYFNQSTKSFGEASQVGKPLYGIEVTNDGLAIFAGGVLLINADNMIVGAVGVSGGSVEEDHAVATAAADALMAGKAPAGQ